MIGMDAATGKPLAGDAHLAQSIERILSTPLGSRVGLRDFGSALFELLDGPLNPLARLRLFAASALAIARWEPRIRVNRFALVADATGQARLTIEGRRTDTRSPAELVRLSIPLRPATL